MSFKEFLHSLVAATRLEASNNVRRQHLSKALDQVALIPGLQDQLEAIQMVADVAQTVRHIIETQPKEQ